MCIQKGDLETGFAESDHVLEGEMRVGGQVRRNPVTTEEIILSMWVQNLRCRW